ncbi:Reverse transcriptase [Trichuris trichiura]|uniref:Reverse transcriptase n=1 Tax=Trichuris trichiura TaxID=36087 RepID=A0A077ZKT5_TRITR|nr:Reverse transcriptase [Trichuris trichiura]
MVRQRVERVLHLPVSTLPDDFIHLPKKKKKSGLSFISLQETADRTTIRLVLSDSRSTDTAAQSVSELWFNQLCRSRLIRWQGVATSEQASLNVAKTARAAAREAKFMATYQGTGYKEFCDWRSNGWIAGEGMTGHNFIAALKVRTSLVPTRLRALKSRPELGDRRVLCRKCGVVSGAPESLSHISQNCAFTGRLIVLRHNGILNKLMQSVEASGFHLVHEPVIWLEGETFKPYLLFTRDDSCWVVNVAIPWETTVSVNRCHAEKCRKYERFKRAGLKLTGAKSFGAGAVVIGAQGGWCRPTTTSHRAAHSTNVAKNQQGHR